MIKIHNVKASPKENPPYPNIPSSLMAINIICYLCVFKQYYMICTNEYVYVSIFYSNVRL